MTSFSDIITFTRSSAAWRYNEFGILEQVPANQPRFDYDPVTLALRGLLVEEQRTNLALQSGNVAVSPWVSSGAPSVTGAYALAPDGTMSATRVVFTASGGFQARAQNVAGIIGTTYTASFWIRATTTPGQTVRIWFDGTGGVSAPAVVTTTMEWTRYSVTGAAADTTLTLQISISNPTTDADILVWGAQLEAGAFPTSYIPTTSSQVTRAADVASVNTLSPWFNPDEGTLFVEAIPGSGLVASKGIVSLFSGPANRITLFRQAQADAPFRWYNSPGTPDRGGVVGGSAPDGAVVKGAAAFDSGGYRALSVNGSAVVQASVTGGPDFGAFESLGIMRSYGTTNELMNGHIRRIRYWPRRLFDNELQRITA